MLDLAHIARLEEARQARALCEVAPEFRLLGAPSLEAGAAVAGLAEPGSWFNAVINLGMAGPVTREALDEISACYIARGIQPRIDLCPYADASVVKHAAALGFVLNPGYGEPCTPMPFETVLCRALPGRHDAPVTAAHALSRDIELAVVDPRDDERVREYVDVGLRGFFPPGVEPTDADRASVRTVLNHPRTTAACALHAGRIIGVGAMEISGDVCALFGATVATEFRRRGVQQALIAHRLNIATQRGAQVATIGSRPGIPTERNVMRMGFAVAYTKVILVKQVVGLVGVKG